MGVMAFATHPDLGILPDLPAQPQLSLSTDILSSGCNVVDTEVVFVEAHRASCKDNPLVVEQLPVGKVAVKIVRVDPGTSGNKGAAGILPAQ